MTCNQEVIADEACQLQCLKFEAIICCQLA